MQFAKLSHSVPGVGLELFSSNFTNHTQKGQF